MGTNKNLVEFTINLANVNKGVATATIHGATSENSKAAGEWLDGEDFFYHVQSVTKDNITSDNRKIVIDLDGNSETTEDLLTINIRFAEDVILATE